ncbi:Cell division control protein-like protein [Hapsidospora chrysogenum ATCC 11550]|uniref:Cell division control protein-like protein n=1 Tax=Hapsidospora chrysogenum (strain ATCC 11550 / CBS 779.69 / DSM 880 / IAM 14645 / JCM 23072 / IMI 49137) TaxID=857340 RepID=A0A086T1W3_HAPC1|nr:Cell division control protein-like protein [Hapsidospora chrysogenum ATCC 11550]
MARHNIPLADKLAHGMKKQSRKLWAYARGPGRQRAGRLGLRVLHRIAINLQPRRLLSFPHLLVGFWIIILLWGERWVFDSKVDNCDWNHWEDWPKNANPHHLIFIADPQLIDPHSYPGRPWPLSSLTTLVTDNYLLRSYRALQTHLSPDSVFFLGDLFDGGREWKPARGKFADPRFGRQRSGEEARWVDTWRRKYGEDYWLREYKRFGDIFLNHFNDGGDAPGSWQRGRKLVASLPGNHDLGFGAQVQVSVRDRFEAFFGDVNRVDVIGNHTIVSVDTVSLSAEASEYRNSHDLSPIYGPVNKFLDNVQATKRKAVQEDLSAWHDIDRDLVYHHIVEELDRSDLDRFPHYDPGPGAADLPTILLSHVPLYREAGTPCGPQREHWPPTKPPAGQSEPVKPDHRNALSIAAGYQYQNVLSADHSSKLLDKVGNVVHIFSGDDHDYCEVVHAGGVREITVKSLSMAMGVPTPGFVMASLYNPVDEKGNKVPGAPETTLQTHLCLLPNQLRTYMRYVGFIIFSLAVLAVRAMLVPVLNLRPFALDPSEEATLAVNGGGGLLPTASRAKDKLEPPDLQQSGLSASAASGWGPRTRSSSLRPNGRWQSSKRGARLRPGGGPRINLDEGFYDTRRGRTDGRRVLGVVGREMWTTTWRVAWMAVLFWVHLARER